MMNSSAPWKWMGVLVLSGGLLISCSSDDGGGGEKTPPPELTGETALSTAESYCEKNESIQDLQPVLAENIGGSFMSAFSGSGSVGGTCANPGSVSVPDFENQTSGTITFENLCFEDGLNNQTILNGSMSYSYSQDDNGVRISINYNTFNITAPGVDVTMGGSLVWEIGTDNTGDMPFGFAMTGDFTVTDNTTGETFELHDFDLAGQGNFSSGDVDGEMVLEDGTTVNVTVNGNLYELATEGDQKVVIDAETNDVILYENANAEGEVVGNAECQLQPEIAG